MNVANRLVSENGGRLRAAASFLLVLGSTAILNMLGAHHLVAKVGRVAVSDRPRMNMLVDL